MWRDLVSEPDGTVRVAGELLPAVGGRSAYASAIALFAEAAFEQGKPVLVRSSGEGGQTWFTVAADGGVAMADEPETVEGEWPPPAPPSRAAQPPIDTNVSNDNAVQPTADPADDTQATRRKPSAADFGAHTVRRAPSPAQEGWRGVVNQVSAHTFRLPPGATERRHREWRASAQRGLTGHRTVVFVNLKGGATKTTASYLAGATLGRVRGGNVLAWDNNENQGTLGDLAMSASHDNTATDLLANIERFNVPSNSPELMNYMRPQGENRFHVLASQNKASNQEVIDGFAFVQMHGMLRQFYHLIVVDTGNAATASTWQAAVEIADEIVLVALNKRDSTKKLAATVDTLIARGLEDKLARGVLILTEPARPARKGSARDKAADEQREWIGEHFRHYVRDVVAVPYDEALADGAEILFENLAPTTQRAYLAATAAIVDGL